ncbi:MAG TPA: toxin TcdB middle/N-terminal domain-containing protein, partial [Thermoanaerobaculia bacterium]|nr:toxin TcdB middle/N-terminal domain-containing protein [Thermoanaerobaculia bacterium]
AGAVDGVPDRLRFLDPCGGRKPYLLTEMDNQMGARTRLEYRPSTRDRLRDAADPQLRWRTPLPFPIHVVARVTVEDAISGGRATSQFSYHHGYWDGVERELRGFGRVDMLDTEDFETFQGPHAVAAEDFMPPLLTRTWYHLGPVPQGDGGWAPADFSAEVWDEPGTGRGGMLGPLRDELAALLHTLDRGQRRDALRALGGQPLRSETYLRDGSPRQDRPLTVEEHAQQLVILPEPQAPGGMLWLVYGAGLRETRWERGDEPMTHFRFSGEVDAWGQARLEVNFAVPRGRNPLVALPAGSPSEPYLAGVQRRRYLPARGQAPALPDRLWWEAGYEGLNDGREDVWTLRARLAGPVGPSSHRLLAYTRHYYDGDAFQGLPFGQMGATGALIRSERLAFTDVLLEDLSWDGGEDWDETRLERPFCLKPSGAPAAGWSDATAYPASYRAMFKDGYTAAGYSVRSMTEELAGLDAEQREPLALLAGAGWLYYVPSMRSRFDFQDADPGRRRAARGMVLEALDPDTGKTATITYDPDYGLLPVAMDDPLGLRTQAGYDLRWLQIAKLTDPHGHTRHVRLNDLGLVVASWMQSRDGSEGDTAAKPLSVLEYDLHAFRTGGSPAWVRSRERVYHALDADLPSGVDADAEMVQVSYSDGFGREIQTRAQAESVVFGSGPFAESVLPPARSAVDFDPVEGQENSRRVIVSGWKRFNNKGAVVEQWEPFFDEGFAYHPPTREQLGQSVRFRLDPGGQSGRTLYPDGSEALQLQGVPRALDRPDQLQPTPWEATSYDPQDNGGRTHPVENAGSSALWDTPASVHMDALGRAVRRTMRTRDPLTGAIVELHTETALDFQGGTRYAADELGRRTVAHEITLSDGRVLRAYDLLGRAWWVRTVDSRHPGAPAQPGTQRLVLDAQGKVIEARGVKGSWSLTVLDAWHRPVEIWARDDAGATLGLRQLLEYGETVHGADGARTRNALNRVVRHWDEAGLNRLDAIDFKGQILEKTRLVLKEDGFLDIFAAGAWDTLKPYRADWKDAATRASLLGDAFTTTTAYDALGRPKRVKLPVDAEGKRRVLLPGYNRAGSLERLELSDGATTETLIERIAHNARGQRLLLLHGAGVLCLYAYDPRTRRLARMRSERATVAGLRITPRKNDADLLEHVFQDTSYEYDLAGNPLAILEQSPDCGLPVEPHRLERRFTYDPLYRLLSATGRETDFLDPMFVPKDVWEEGAPRTQDVTKARRYEETYSYDRAGNLLGMKRGLYNRTFQPATANNRLERITIADGGTTVYDQASDLAGNLTRQGTSRHLDWDQANRLAAFRVQAAPTSEPSVYAQHAYDAAGQRVIRLVRKQGGSWERIVSIDGVFEHVQQVKAATTKIATHLYVLDGQRRLMSFRFGDAMDDRTPAIKILLDDHLGSSIVTLDDKAQRVNREEYRPYGETCFGSHAFKRFRFTGKERDDESGFQYHGARFYDPYQGRWISPDPAGSADGHNHYWYARGNPVRLNDPTGTEASEGDHPHQEAYEAKRAELLDEAKKVGGTSSLQVRSEKAKSKGGGKKFNPIAWLENQETWGDFGQKYKNMFVEGLQENLANGSSPYASLFKSSEFTDLSNDIFKIIRSSSRSKLENQLVKEYVTGIERDAKAIIRVFTEQMVKTYGEIPIPGKTKVGPGFPEMSGDAAVGMRKLLDAARAAGFNNKELAFGSIRGIHDQGSRYAEFLKRGFIDGDLSGAVVGTIIWPGRMNGGDPNQLKHATGRAADFSILYTGGKGETEAQIQARYDKLRDPGKERAYDLHVWLVLHAHELGFHPISNEPWHWEYDPSAKYSIAAYLARDRYQTGIPPEWKFLFKLWFNRLFLDNRFYGPGF